MKFPVFALFVLLTSPAFANEAQRGDSELPVFAAIFGDRMVLQRETPIRLWGRAPPREKLTVRIADRSRTTSADAEGNWRVELPALPAGGPHRLTLRAGGTIVRELADVLIGDLWLCSGQSNMEVPVGGASGAAQGLETPRNAIRLATIPHDTAVMPRTELAAKPEWTIADQQSVRDFSAVCWFFARELQAREPVPLGLIHASWGGSRIEAWLAADALRDVGGFESGLALLQDYAADQRASNKRFAAIWEDWWQRAGDGTGRPWSADDASARWTDVPGELRDWKTWGDPSLADHDGMVWFRNSFRLSDEQAGDEANLTLGGIDEVDLTWLNGTFVGTQFGWGTERRYAVPTGLPRARANTVTLNVMSSWGSGGMLGPNERVALRFDDGTTVSLADGWQYSKIPAETGWPPRAPWESISGLTGLFNAMIAPLGELPMTGALWYQGESNAGDAEGYERLLAALAANWRRRFGASFAFVIVQLPNFGTPPIGPVESGWARVRDAQRRVARDDPDTGLVVTIDAGDNRDLHPPDKEIVGRRAADVAGALVYGRPGIVDGIGPARATRRGDSVVVEFAPARETLVVAGDRTPIAFELCGEEASGCAYAHAALEDGRIVLSTPDVPDPVRVRHCWADAPICNLYGASGLPVGTFEVSITR